MLKICLTIPSLPIESFSKAEAREIGIYTCELPSMHFQGSSPTAASGPPIGRTTEYVYRDLLGYTDEEIAEFIMQGVITTEEDLP